MASGWYKESRRHALASKGVKTSSNPINKTMERTMKLNEEMKIKQLEKKLQKAKDDEEKYRMLSDKLYKEKEKDKTIRELRKKLKQQELKYEKPGNHAYEKAEELEQKQYDIERNLELEKKKLSVKKAKKTGEFNTESAIAFLESQQKTHKDEDYPEEKYKVIFDIQRPKKESDNAANNQYFHMKKELPNGIKIFQNNKWRKNEYFAFKGTKLVGYWGKEKPQHRGDYTSSHAWLGEKNLTYKNEFVIPGKYGKRSPKYKEWSEALSRKRKFEIIPLTTKNMLSMGASTIRIDR